MSNPLYRERFHRPELFLSELLKKNAQGQFWDKDDNIPFLSRAVVVAVDPTGGRLENPTGEGKMTFQINGTSYDVPANIGPANPQNSIKARIINDGYDQFVHDDRLRVFWPLGQEHSSNPIKPGEYVYVIFEDSDSQNGLWITKIPDQQDVNYFPGVKDFESASADSLSSKFDDTRGVGDTQTSQLNTEEAATQSKPDRQLAKLFGDM